MLLITATYLLKFIFIFADISMVDRLMMSQMCRFDVTVVIRVSSLGCIAVYFNFLKETSVVKIKRNSSKLAADSKIVIGHR